MEVTIRIDSFTTRVERLCNACDYCLDRMFNVNYGNIDLSTSCYYKFYNELNHFVITYPSLLSNDINISHLMKETINAMTKNHRKKVKEKRFSL